MKHRLQPGDTTREVDGLTHLVAFLEKFSGNYVLTCRPNVYHAISVAKRVRTAPTCVACMAGVSVEDLRW